MIVCKICSHSNPPGHILCQRCGTVLNVKSYDTHSLNSSDMEAAKASQTPKPKPEKRGTGLLGNDVFPANAILRLEVNGYGQPLTAPIPERILIGRPDPMTGLKPEIDLTPLAGYRMGVSRRHAEIRRDGEYYLVVADLGSSNGTYLNNEKLSMNKAYRLREGDELRLGNILLRVYFDIEGKTEE